MLLYKIILQQQLLLSISFVIAYEISHHNLLSGNDNNNDNNNNNSISFNMSSVLSSSLSSLSSASGILSSSTRNDLIYSRIQYDNDEDLNSNSNIEYHHHYDGLKNDINDFIKLIPIDNVQNVIKYYYNTDTDVKHALIYLESKDFIQLKDKIIKIQQMQNFLKYLNQTDFDVISHLNTLVKLIGEPRTYNDEMQILQNDTADGNAAATAVSVENSTATTITTSAGLHGLVDDILDVLPQDQILSLFFEKLETSNEFSNFIHNIGSEEFSDILDSMKESRELRNLVYTLHNNGIFIGRIIDSLKAYFFLGTF